MRNNLCLLTTIGVAVTLAASVQAFALKHHGDDEFALGQVSTVQVPLSTETTATQSPLECGAPENFLSGTFTAWDYSVVLGMLIISIGIGDYDECERSDDILLTLHFVLYRCVLWVFRQSVGQLGGLPARLWHEIVSGQSQFDYQLHYCHRVAGQSVGDVLQRNAVFANR